MLRMGRIVRVLAAPLLLAWVSISGCASTLPPPKDMPGQRRVWWSPTLELPSLANIAAEMQKPFMDTFPVSRRRQSTAETANISTCTDYFRLTGQGFHAESDQDIALLQMAGARCHALKILADAGFVGSVPNPSTDWRALGLESLPPALGPQVNPADRDERTAASAIGKTWKAAEPSARLTAEAPNRAEVVGQDWTVTLELWAVGDFVKAGRDQLLVFSRAKGTEGSWQEIELRLLDRPPSKGPYQVIRTAPL